MRQETDYRHWLKMFAEYIAQIIINICQASLGRFAGGCFNQKSTSILNDMMCIAPLIAICDIVQRRLSARMMRRMQLFQPFPRHVCIDLRRRNICMAQQHLHHAQIRTVIEQVGGEGVAQGVW